MKYGDCNASFFHRTTIVQRHKNKVFRLDNDDGSVVESRKEIGLMIVDYFQRLFTSSRGGCFDWIDVVVMDSMNDVLCIDFTIEEVRTIAFQIGASSALGPDVFSEIFYQHHWSIIGPKVTQAIQNFFISNDALLFIEANEDNAINLKDILVLYCQVLGQEIN